MKNKPIVEFMTVIKNPCGINSAQPSADIYDS